MKEIIIKRFLANSESDTIYQSLE